MATVIMGQSPPSSTYNTEGEGLPFFQGKAEFGAVHPTAVKWCSAPTKVAEPNDVLMSVRAPVGPTNLATERCCIGRGLASIRAEPGVRSKWLLHAFRAMERSIDALGTGTTFKAISGETLRQLQVPIADLDVQDRAIAEIEKQFSRLDEAVANLKRVKANLQHYVAATLRAAFAGELVTKEADLARQHGRTFERGSELLASLILPRDGRQSSTAGLLRTSIGESAIEGWTWTTLGECFKVAVGATPSRKEPAYWGGSVSWVSSGEVQFSRVSRTNESITEAGLANSSTQINPAGSVLLGMIGQGRTRGQAAILDIAAANNQNCAAIWVSQTRVPSEFVYYWLMSRYEQTRGEGSGNNQQALNKKLVEAIPLPLPPLLEQHRIVAEVDRRLSIVLEVEAEVDANLKRAQALRQAVLERAFGGGVSGRPASRRASCAA